MKKRYLTILIVLLVVGFAAVTANLILNGTVSILADQEAFAKDVIFTKAKIKGGSAVIENEGKSITFISPTIRSLNEEAILNFTITNYNRQYDAEATIKCDFVKDDTLLGEEDFSEYIDVKTDATSYFIPASGNTPGQVISTLKKTYIEEEDQEVKIECTLIVEAKSKDYLEDELVRPSSDNTIKYVPINYNGEFWAYKGEITNIVFENELNPHTGDNVEEYNISESGTGNVIAYYDKDAKTVYIQGDGNIFANKDSSWLFYLFTNLQTIDGLEFLNTSQVINMNRMFYLCRSLGNIGGMSSWDTSSVTNMSGMFQNCIKLTSLDLSTWDTSSVTTMSNMFCDCNLLKSVGDLSTWDTSRVTNMTTMFKGCQALTKLDLSNWDTSSVTDMSGMFYDCKLLEGVGDLSKWDTSQVTTMDTMFRGCQALTKLDLSSWDTSSVTTMFGMFISCSSLESVGNLSKWDTSNVIDMQSMFASCQALTKLDLSNWDTSKVTKMGSMFAMCSSLENVGNLSSWDTSSVTDMASMFTGCYKLTSLDLTSWNTSQVTDMRNMFDGCSSLESVGDLSSWDISQVTNYQSMFQNSPKINTTINITLKVTTYFLDMFKGAVTEEGASIIVNYTEENINLVNGMIAQKSDNSNVSLGSVIPYYNITTSDDIVATSNASKNYVNVKITLTAQSGKEITSFKVNGKLVKGNSFKMPNNDVTITDVVTK